MSRFKRSFLIVFSFFTIPSPVSAHIISGSGFHSGFFHPLTGIDHLLAMVAVGVLSTYLIRRDVWKVLAIFVTSMIAGGMFGLNGVGMGGVEIGVALSVSIFGLCIAFPQRFSPQFMILAISCAGICHGYAHGTEIPTVAHPYAYIVGFVLSTAMLHIGGIYIARATSLYDQTMTMVRRSGGVILGCIGLFLLIG